MPDWLAIVFLAAMGACVGSFLNVVIYRMPRGESIVHPGSHCPRCNRAIAWYDNIPVLSYLALGGKCRYCRTPISPRYGLVELITAVLFVALYDAFYRVGMHSWMGNLAVDWPLFAAHLVLLAVLVAASALDIEYYLIDIRITYVAMIVGLVGWTFLPELTVTEQYRLGAVDVGLLGGVFGAGIGLVVRHLLLRSSESDVTDTQDHQEQEAKQDAALPVSPSRAWVVALVFFFLGSLGLIAWAILGGATVQDFKPRGFMYLVWAFLAIVAGAVPRRSSDEEIVQIIEQEKSTARKVAGVELLGLLPVIIGFVVGFVLFRYVAPMEAFGSKAYGWRADSFMPVRGFMIALTGLISAAAFGWVVRIVFTLVFGKEAMGVGDIYILAGVGAVAGAFVTIIGFFLGSVIGVVGILVLLLWKTSRALSYGPWIAIGALTCLLFYKSLVEYLRPLGTMVRQLYGDG